MSYNKPIKFLFDKAGAYLTMFILSFGGDGVNKIDGFAKSTAAYHHIFVVIRRRVFLISQIPYTFNKVNYTKVFLSCFTNHYY
jgi:hypothetical protein